MREEVLQTGRQRQLHGRLWTVDGADRGTVIVVHGLGDHGGRYEELASHLGKRGWNVFAFDLIGHGRSPGSRGRADSYDGLLADLAEARRTVAERCPGQQQVILGHSMGGNLALNYALRWRQFDSDLGPLLGLVLCAPMLMPPTPPARPQIFAAWLTGHLLPWLRVGKPVAVEHLTQDPARGESIRNDELMHSRISIYLATQLLSQGRWALDHARDVDVNTLIMHGEDDQLIDQSACHHVAIRIGPKAELVRWPAMRHDLFHETMRNEIADRLADWLDGLA